LAGDELGGGVGGDQLGAQVGGLDLQPDLVGGAGVGHGERVRLGQVRVQAHTAQVLGHPGGPGSVRHLFGAAGAVVGDVGQQGERLLPAAHALLPDDDRHQAAVEVEVGELLAEPVHAGVVGAGAEEAEGGGRATAVQSGVQHGAAVGGGELGP